MGISNVSSSVSSYTTDSQLAQTLFDSLDADSTAGSLLSSTSSDSSSISDILDLSSESQSSSDSLFDLLLSLSLSNTQLSVDQLGSSVEDKITEALEAAGIDTSEEIDLQVDSDGNIVVTNDNSQADEIEEVLNGDETLKNTISQYLSFMKTVAPTLESSSSSTDSQLEQLLASLTASTSSSDDATGTITLILSDGDFTTTYQKSSTETVTVSSSTD